MKCKVLLKVLALIVCLFMVSATIVWAETCETDLNCDGEVNRLDKKYFNETYKAERGMTGCESCSPCPSGLIDCDGTCVDPMTDESNCGSCGIVCLDGESCWSGTCGCTPLDEYCVASSECCFSDINCCCFSELTPSATYCTPRQECNPDLMHYCR